AFVETETPGSLVAVMNAHGSHQHRLTDMREWASGPSWSPDGSLIAYVQSYAPGTGIHLVHPDGTGDRLVAPGVFGSGFQPAWSPQGDRLAVVTPTARGSAALTVVDVRDGSTHELVRNGYFSNPAWSPDGGSIAY